MNHPVLFIAPLLILLSACAKVGAPSGGPKDISPPVIKSSKPFHLQKNTQPTEIRFEFDEFIQLNQPQKNIIINPHPGAFETDIQGRELRITLAEPLQQNQTYSLQLIEAIKDNNESNVLPYALVAFSTGNDIDESKLMVKGTLAIHGKPSAINVLLDTNTNLLDSFTTESFVYHTMGKKELPAQLNFIKPDTYKLVAFQDVNENNIYDTQEPIGISIIEIKDSSYADISLSIPRIPVSHYKILSHNYQPALSRLYFEFNEAIDSSYPLKVDVSIDPILSSKKSSPLFHLSNSRDSLFVYLKASEDDSIKTSIQLADSVFTVMDAIYAADSFPWAYTFKRIHKDDRYYLSIQSTIPLISTNSRFLSLFNTTDSTKISIDSVSMPSSFEIKIHAGFSPGINYLLTMNEGFIRSPLPLVFKTSDSLSFSFTSESSHSIHLLPDFPECAHPIFYLHNSEGKKIQSNKNPNNLIFKNLKPGSYFISCLDDLNNNGIYDPIQLWPFSQAEPIYHSTSSIEIKEGWDLENYSVEIR